MRRRGSWVLFSARGLKADIDAELNRVGEDDSWLEAGVRGVDYAEKFVGNIEVHGIGDLPDESRADRKSWGVRLFELVGGLGVIDLCNLELGVGEAEPSGEIRFPAALAWPTKDGGDESRNLNVATGEGEAAVANRFGSPVKSEGAVAVKMIEAVVENASGKLDPQPVGKVKARSDIEADSWIYGDGWICQGPYDSREDGAG